MLTGTNSREAVCDPGATIAINVLFMNLHKLLELLLCFCILFQLLLGTEWVAGPRISRLSSQITPA